MWDAAGELDDLGAAHDLAGGVGEDFTVLFSDQTSQSAALAIEQLAELEQDSRSGQRRGRRPAWKGRRRRPHSPVDLFRRRKGDAAAPLASRGIVDIAPAPARSLGALAVDIVVDVAHAVTRSMIDRRRAS